MKHFIKYTLIMCVFSVCALSFVSCKDDDKKEEKSGLKGWYTDLSNVAKTSDFDMLNSAINAKEVLTSYYYGGSRHTYIASRELFIDSDGMYNDHEAHCGRLRFSITSFITAIRIVDDQTLISYLGYLYETGASRDDAIYNLYAGPIFGNMTYYGTGDYYTYVKVENKIIVSNGEIYTITTDGLRKDGSSNRLSKYDPTKIY